MIIFYFTSTGNNLYIAKKLGGQSYSIPNLLKKGDKLEFSDETIGIVFPCYYLGVPQMIKEFLQRVTLKSDYIFAIMSFGNYAGGALDQFLSISRQARCSLSYLNQICMIDNYIPLFDISIQKKSAPSKMIDSCLDYIISDIAVHKNYIRKSGLTNRLVTFFAQCYYAVNVKNADNRLSVDSSCNGCRICESVCPAENIKVSEKPEFLHHCIECLACTHHCPQNAIRVKGEKSRERFINEHVSTREIIEANN
jgi:NAD-dependent dihydropyrimidine dehydrogenase PreA subunit/protein involved in ribonucleotide reduction